MKDTSWDHALEVTADGNGLVGHAGGMLLRKLADQVGLTSELDTALTQKGTFPQISRGMVLVSTAIAIAMGGTAMADIELYVKMINAGKAPGTAHHVHRTIRNALNKAKRRGHIPQNPALLAKAPKLSDDEAEPYSVAEVRRLLALVAERRNGPRWVIALALGLRQGEALGLKWEHVDLDTGLARIRRNRLRPKYEHGCGGTCGRKMAGYCPDRKQTRPDTGPTKSRAGRRVVGLPDPLIVLLKAHKEAQEVERTAARQLWHDEGWVFATPEGGPLNPWTDYHEWKALIEEAGLPERRLHDARHTAATVLAILAVPTPTAMAIMGWSSAEMAARYQHVLDSIRKGVADQVGGLLWGTDGDPVADHPNDR